MNNELIERLNRYHQGPKVKVDGHYEAAAEPAPAKPAPQNQAVSGMETAARAFVELAKLYRNSGA